MKPPSLKPIKVKNLRKLLLSRSFAVPKLQRNFVWDPNRAAKLLDSIYRDMPIGSLFLWEMDKKSAHLIRQSTGVLPAFSARNARIWFVIDGQQRLSVIHQAFEAQQRTNDAGRVIDFGRLCFVVDPAEGGEEPQRIVYRKPQGKEFVPLRDILAPSPEWKSRMPSKATAFLAKIDKCRQQLLEYPVPVVTIRSATLKEIGEVFIRVNSQGMRITSADRAIALMGKIDVRAMAEELRQKVRDQKFALGTIDPILMGFNLVSERPALDGGPPKLALMAARWARQIEKSELEKARFRKIWHKYQAAFLSALDHLRQRYHVYDESFLPSANMVATLSVFFFHHSGQPTSSQSTEIRKWFWATAVAQRYSGRGYHRNIVADANFMESLGKGRNRRFVFSERLDPVTEIQKSEYGSRSSRSRAFFCLLASLSPQYLDSGEKLPLGPNVFSHQNRKHRHHIFPRAQLKNHFPSKEYNSLCNICFLVAHDNSKVGSKVPRNYLDDYREAGVRRFNKVMQSHLIPAGKQDGVWQTGLVAAYKAFRKERLLLICRAFEREAGIKLFKVD